MALFKKQEQMSLEEILKAVEMLSAEDKAKIAAKVVVEDNKDAKAEDETGTQIDKAKEDISADGDSKGQDAKDRVDDSEAQHAELESLRGDMATLQSQVADILAKLENLPMGAHGLGGIMTEDGNEWQGKATKAYPFSR